MKAPTLAFVLLLLGLCLSLLLLDRKKLIIPIIISACFLPADLPVTIATLNFYPLRFIALIALSRLFLSGAFASISFNKIDWLFFAYNILGSIIYILASENTLAAIVYKSGVGVDTICLYLVFRAIIQGEDTIKIAVKTFCVAVIVLLPFVIYEYIFATNLFSILGRSSISLRQGEIRTAATFSHAILFGSFAAALIPVFWAALKAKGGKMNIVALLSCLFYVVACSSSGPVVSTIGAISLLLFFRWREKGSLLAWSIGILALAIHIIRDSPLWHFLYIRITIKASSTGLHRYLLTEAAIKESRHWWLMGYGDVGPQWHTKYWPSSHANFTDVTNHYLLEGVRGGSITMLLFIILCYQAVKTLGKCSLRSQEPNSQWRWWGFTVMMITQCITFLAVAYFGQITMLLFLNIAVAAFGLNHLRKMDSESVDMAPTHSRKLSISQ